MNPHETDDSIIYVDTRRFTRGRAGYRPEPPADVNAKIVAIGIGVLGVLAVAGMVFGIIHLLLPSVS